MKRGKPGEEPVLRQLVGTSGPSSNGTENQNPVTMIFLAGFSPFFLALLLDPEGS